MPRTFTPAVDLCAHCGHGIAVHVNEACPSGLSFIEHQRRELVRAREKHGPITSIHAAYGIILEELEEFWDEVKKQQRDFPKMAEELIQVAAMCQRTFEDLRINEGFRPR